MNTASTQVIAGLIVRLEDEEKFHERELTRCRQQINGYKIAIEHINRAEAIQAEELAKAERFQEEKK